ncbi:MAG: 16S rRNA processing protein RimM [Candidatus Rokubacteria bacterium]|nr:16S rRNA processing protein RimM [Candidatus Rokubacteria bacterium]
MEVPRAERGGEPQPLVAIGELLRPHGLRGEVRVRPLTDRPRERFERLCACVLWEPATDGRQRCRIVSRRFDADGVLIRLEGVESPEAARPLCGRLLAVPRAEALPPGPGRFYPWQLEGAVVETREGRRLGTFLRVEGSPAQPLWVIGDGEREWLLPAVADFVVEVDVAAGRVVADPPEGLLEL